MFVEGGQPLSTYVAIGVRKIAGRKGVWGRKNCEEKVELSQEIFWGESYRDSDRMIECQPFRRIAIGLKSLGQVTADGYAGMIQITALFRNLCAGVFDGALRQSIELVKSKK